MNKVRKMQTAAGGPLQLTPEEQKYLEWSKMTPEQKRKYRINRAKSHLQSGPNITNFWEAFQTYIGNRDPENPNLTTGIVNAPGRATPQQVQQSAKLMETINNYWKNLGKLKIRLGGNGKYTSGILTKPGTAPTTFNGQNINYITSPKGGNVTHKFYTDQGSEYILTKDGFARRIKSPHSNVEGSDSGLHDWNEGTTIFTNGEDGKLFNTAFYKFSDFGFKPGTYGLVRQNGKAKIMLIDPKTKQWREAMFSDAYPTSVKEGLQQDRVLSVDYSDIPFVGGHILEKTSGSWHPGSQVAFIEGLKQGGKMNILEFLKNGSGIHIKKKNRGKFTSYCGGKVTDECIQKGKNSSNPAIRKRAVFAANARKWKHKEGGTVKAQEGTKFNWGSAIGNLASTALQQGVSTYVQNKKLSSDAEAEKEKYKSEAASKLQKDMQDERTKRFNILNAIKGTSDNPNAFGGGIFENYFINQGDNEAIRNYNQSISDYNKMIDQQVRAQKAENTGNFLSSLGQQGVGLLANSAFSKNSPASTNTTSSTNTSYNLSNFWSTPSLSNNLSNQSTLYNSDKFWNIGQK